MKIRCPVLGCGAEAEEDDLEAQRAHMTNPETLQAQHGEFIEARMVSNGFRRDPFTQKWVDVWSSD